MKKLLCIYCLLCITALAYAQNLKFNANGKFKIVQFTVSIRRNAPFTL